MTISKLSTASVAQSVERGPFKPVVAGSSPAGGVFFVFASFWIINSRGRSCIYQRFHKTTHRKDVLLDKIYIMSVIHITGDRCCCIVIGKSLLMFVFPLACSICCNCLKFCCLSCYLRRSYDLSSTIYKLYNLTRNCGSSKFLENHFSKHTYFVVTSVISLPARIFSNI